MHAIDPRHLSTITGGAAADPSCVPDPGQGGRPPDAMPGMPAPGGAGPQETSTTTDLTAALRTWGK
ncbi:MAG: hypothetical protein JNK64_28985 [Myxococcales bacterium]|nr:hypothetical protein [Myxococcales bacterium]